MMKSLFYLLAPALLVSEWAAAQKVTNRLQFNQGQTLEIVMDTKTTIAQQAMGQAIDFNLDGTGLHQYEVTNATEENTTLRHRVKQVRFSFDGMGQKRSFDSGNDKDLNGPMGKPLKEMLEKKYDLILDTAGTTLMAMPEKVELPGGDSRAAMITSMMGDLMALVQPPKKGTASFFRVLPDSAVGVGSTWTETTPLETGNRDAAYRLSEINDTTIVVDFATSSSTRTKAEMMGSEITTNMNNKSTGRIIIDRATGLMRQKNETIESNGSTETGFGTVPITSRTTTTIQVTPRN
jgi:hypothetical protein